MLVSETFESHRELWFSDSVSEETKAAKAANLNKFGDQEAYQVIPIVIGATLSPAKTMYIVIRVIGIKM